MLNRVLAAAAIAVLAPAAASAQTDTPAAQQPDTPVGRQSDPALPAPSNIPPPVEQQQIAAPDAWSVSALSRADGALPETLWSRSDPAFLVTLFDRLPANYDSPASRSLALRVLLSGGQAPRGDAQEAARKRFEALGKMGAADPLATMAAGAGASLNDPVIAQYAAQAELARGNRDQACMRGRAAQMGNVASPFLLRLRAFCSAATGDRAAAELALAQPHPASPDDPWYVIAIEAIAGAPPRRAPAARYDNSLSTQLSLAANFAPGANAFANASTLALVTLARSDHAPALQRAQAAALAFRRGVISAQEARAILQATPGAVAAGLPAIATALRAVQAATPGSLEAATAIANVLRAATAPADFAAASRIFRDDINGLQTAPDAIAALQFARAAVVNGDVQAAQRLTTSARQAGVDQIAMGPVEAALAALVGVDGDQGGAALHRRIDAAGATAPARRAAARDVMILAALGAPVDGPVQSFIVDNPPQGGARAESGAMLALSSAVENQALGDAALLATVAAGNGPAKLDAESISNVIRALRGVRLDNDARRFAVEALLAGAPS
jgi:hypothetical protein